MRVNLSIHAGTQPSRHQSGPRWRRLCIERHLTSDFASQDHAIYPPRKTSPWSWYTAYDMVECCTLHSTMVSVTSDPFTERRERAIIHFLKATSREGSCNVKTHKRAMDYYYYYYSMIYLIGIYTFKMDECNSTANTRPYEPIPRCHLPARDDV
jgi:hypothetical protein